MRKKSSARRASETARQSGKAALAAWTAASTSSAEAKSTDPVCSPVAGSKTGPALPELPSRRRPPIQWLIALTACGASASSVIVPSLHSSRAAYRASGAGDLVTIPQWRPSSTNPELGQQIIEDAKRYVLYSWSVQDAISPIAVAGGEGRYFWDYDGKRYLDFASQLVNVSIGYGHPKIVAAIKEQAEKLATIGPPMATESRSRLGEAARRGDAG